MIGLELVRLEEGDKAAGEWFAGLRSHRSAVSILTNQTDPDDVRRELAYQFEQIIWEHRFLTHRITAQLERRAAVSGAVR